MRGAAQPERLDHGGAAWPGVGVGRAHALGAQSVDQLGEPGRQRVAGDALVAWARPQEGRGVPVAHHRVAPDDPGEPVEDGGRPVGRHGRARELLLDREGGLQRALLLLLDQPGDGPADRDERHGPRHGEQRQADPAGGGHQRRGHLDVRQPDPEPDGDRARPAEPIDVAGPRRVVPRRGREAGREDDLAALEERRGIVELARGHPPDGRVRAAVDEDLQPQCRVLHDVGEYRHPPNMHHATVVTMQLCASGGDRPLGPSGLRSIVGAGLDRRRSANGAILRADPWSPPRPNTGDDQMTSHEEPEQLTVDVDEPQPGVLVAQLTGWLDLATAPGAEIQLQELLDTRAPRSIVVDLSRTEFLGSAGSPCCCACAAARSPAGASRRAWSG